MDEVAAQEAGKLAVRKLPRSSAVEVRDADHDEAASDTVSSTARQRATC